MRWISSLKFVYIKTMETPGFNPSQLPRRDFLKLSSAGALGITMGSSMILSGDAKPAAASIALQLYTVRREIESDLKGTLQKVADIGFKSVETAFWPDHISLKQGAQALSNAGLKVCSIHCELPIGPEKSRWLEMAEVYDCNTLIWHGWPEDSRYQSIDGIKTLADIYNESYEFAQSQGLSFGLHNHWWEFRNQVDGRYPLEILLEYLHPDVFFEIDTYWVKVAGYDPAEIVGQLGTRAPFLHIKDGPARYTESLGKDEPEPMVAVGQGTQDFKKIVKAAQGQTRWMVIEMDVTATDVFKALGESYQYLLQNELASN